MKKILLILIFALAIIVPYRTSAGGGRFDISTVDSDWQGTTGSGIELRARVTKQNDYPNVSAGEHAEYRIINPRAGDKCDTQDGFTDVNGYLNGNCSATTEGSYSIYIHSNDNGDDSSQVILYFYSPPTPTPAPTSIPTSTPKPTTVLASQISATPTITPSTLVQTSNQKTQEPTPEVAASSSINSTPNNFVIIASVILSVLLLVVAGVLLIYLKWKRLQIRKTEIDPIGEDVTSYSPLLK